MSISDARLADVYRRWLQHMGWQDTTKNRLLFARIVLRIHAERSVL